jgi:hypothetical protein
MVPSRHGQETTQSTNRALQSTRSRSLAKGSRHLWPDLRQRGDQSSPAIGGMQQTSNPTSLRGFAIPPHGSSTGVSWLDEDE